MDLNSFEKVSGNGGNKKRPWIDLNDEPSIVSSGNECRRSDSAHVSPVLVSNFWRSDSAHDPPVVGSKYLSKMVGAVTIDFLGARTDESTQPKLGFPVPDDTEQKVSGKKRPPPLFDFLGARKDGSTQLKFASPAPDDTEQKVSGKNRRPPLFDLNQSVTVSSGDECRGSDSAQSPFVPAAPVLATNFRRSDPPHDPPVDASKSKKGRASIEELPPMESNRKDSWEAEGGGFGKYVKVSMDGEPYHRKTNLKAYKGYLDLVKDLENMFKFTIEREEDYEDSEFAPVYEDKDGDWTLVGDVPWEMFQRSCKRLRIMKGYFSGNRREKSTFLAWVLKKEI